MEIKNDYIKGLWVFLGLFVIFIVINIIIGIYFFEYALFHEIFDLLIPSLLFLILTRQAVFSTTKLNTKLNKRSALIVFQLFLISTLLKIGINYIVFLTGTVDPSAVTNQVIDMVPNLPVLFISVAILPVFIEEFAIRGVVLSYFTNTSFWQSAVMTGLLFGIIHLNLGQLGYTTVLGIVLGAIVLATRSLWGGIFFHFLNNFLTVAFVGLMQLINKIIPVEVEDLMNAQGQEMQYSQNEKIYMMAFAIICLIVGVILTVHYIDKLRKINQKVEITIDTQEDIEYDSVKEKRVSWFRLFINTPVILIAAVYIFIIFYF